MSSIILSAGSYTIEVGPAAFITGLVQELSGDTGYQIEISYYNKSEVLSTRPTVDNGTVEEFPRFE